MEPQRQTAKPFGRGRGGGGGFGGRHGPIFPNESFFLGFTCPALAHVGRYLMYLLCTLLLL